jgi:hypothetical protein
MRALLLLFAAACEAPTMAPSINFAIRTIAGYWTVDDSNNDCHGTMTLLLRDSATIDGNRDCTSGWFVGGPVSGTINDRSVVLRFSYSDGSVSSMSGAWSDDSIYGRGENPIATDHSYTLTAMRIQ